MMIRYILSIGVSFLLSGCYDTLQDRSPDLPFDGTGYRPVYMTPEEAQKIEILPARPLQEPGKIYLLEPYIFINERGKGVHIIDNSNPRNPVPLSFISIPGNFDMAAKATWLYADNLDDLLVFDITDPRAVRLSERIEKAVPVYEFPPYSNVYFECADASRGVITEWEKVSMTNIPKCRR